MTRSSNSMRAKGEAGQLALVACVGMVLLAGVGICSRTPVSSSPLSNQPLVLSFEYCGCRQEIIVEAGRDFHVSSSFDKGVLIADGHIHSVVGDDCRLSLTVEHRFPSGSDDLMMQTDGPMQLDERPLKIGEPSVDTYGAHGSACMMTGPWIRRGIDPVPSLVRALRPNYRDYVTAITELKRLGADGAGAVPRLIEGLQGRIHAPAGAAYERTVPAWSAIALGDIGPAASAAVPALLETLQDQNPRTQIFAASALWKIDRHPAAVPALVRQLTAADWNIRSTALEALAEIGVGAPTAVPALTALLTTDEEPFIRQKAAGVLWKIARRRDVIAVHLEGLTNEALGMRAYAAELLGEMGWAARETVPDIVRALWFSTKREQESMAKALVRIDPNAALTVPELVKAFQNDLRLHGEAPPTIGAAARTIGAFGLAALPELSRVLEDGDPNSTSMAITACYYIGPSSIDFLAGLVESQNPKIREESARGLVTFNYVKTRSEIGRAIPILINRFADSDSGVQTTIDDSLVKIGPDALPALRNLLEHESPEVRNRATVLMKRIESEVE